jgi:hypothetical protein
VINTTDPDVVKLIEKIAEIQPSAKERTARFGEENRDLTQGQEASVESLNDRHRREYPE